MEISFSGLASGLDTASLIEGLMQVERIPLNRLASKKSDIQTQRSRFEQIKAQLTDLRTAVQALDSRDEVLGTRIVSANEQVVTATSLGASTPGEFDVSVSQLARAERTYSDAFADRDVAGVGGSGTLTITVGSEDAVEIDVLSTDTLENVVAKINESGASVSAGLLFDGTDYRIQVAGTKTGADNGVTFTEAAGLNLGLDDPLNEFQSAQDAILTVDGFTITRSENTVSGAVPGVSLNLLDETGLDEAGDPATVQVRVERDPESLKTKVQAFVDAYNKVASSINAEFAFTGEARLGDSLAGDTTLRQLQRSLRDSVSSVVEGADPAYSTLATVGLESNSTGTLELDTTKLEAALADDSEAVFDLFVGNLSLDVPTGAFTALDDLLDSYLADNDGLFDQRLDGFDDRVSDIDEQMERMESRLEQKEQSLRMEFATLETVMSDLQSQGSQLTAMLSGL